MLSSENVREPDNWAKEYSILQYNWTLITGFYIMHVDPDYEQMIDLHYKGRSCKAVRIDGGEREGWGRKSKLIFGSIRRSPRNHEPANIRSWRYNCMLIVLFASLLSLSLLFFPFFLRFSFPLSLCNLFINTSFCIDGTMQATVEASTYRGLLCRLL